MHGVSSRSQSGWLISRDEFATCNPRFIPVSFAVDDEVVVFLRDLVFEALRSQSENSVGNIFDIDTCMDIRAESEHAVDIE